MINRQRCIKCNSTREQYENKNWKYYYSLNCCGHGEDFYHHQWKNDFILISDEEREKTK